ncbi:Cas10/Cmr2 second palm domain-containing protein [Paenibacillus ginsengihumi]|uniref:Cas10/Cmr2 second palm domain-containing protein n=1 Tax=Paenibacillus ginsengihumi TaxID=431596 RepID=UPI00035D0E68|nr:hypothetical protein [Paenibacillus ginsengihumi]
MAVYAYIDISQKQEFIYRHNKLKVNLLNSYIIKKLTEDMGQQKFEAGPTLSLNKFLAEWDVHFVYSGGGNSIIRFPDKELAMKFVNEYSLEVLKVYPEVELYISTVDDAEYDAEDADRDQKIRLSLLKKADQLKDRRKARFRRWSYGIEKIDETGKPVRLRSNEELNGEPDRAGAVNPIERVDQEAAKAYLYRKWEQLTKQSSFETTDELQEYRKDEQSKSYIGVIAIDGNQMGEMVRNTKTFEELGEFSSAIENIYFQAVQEALRSYPPEEKAKRFVTPVVMSGDDLCLIVRGESAVQIAANIVKQIQEISKQMKHTSPLLSRVMTAPYLTACAGVAIVKVTYPFYDAIKAAERLCHQAKEQIHKALKEVSEEGQAAASFIDWEIIHGQAQAEPYDRYVKHRNEREVFHIKPLRIDQEQAFQDGTYGFFPMIALAKQIESDPDISSSLLEEVKKLSYKGRETYESYFHMKQDAKRLTELVSRFFEGRSDKDFPIMQSEEDQSITYLLNDLLGVLPFLGEKVEEVPNHD